MRQKVTPGALDGHKVTPGALDGKKVTHGPWEEVESYHWHFGWTDWNLRRFITSPFGEAESYPWLL